MSNGFINSRSGTGVVFQATKHKPVSFSPSSYSMSTSANDTEGYFALTDSKGREYPFQMVMDTGGKMMVQGWNQSPEEADFYYFSAGENSYLVRRVYYVADNAATDFYVAWDSPRNDNP